MLDILNLHDIKLILLNKNFLKQNIQSKKKILNKLKPFEKVNMIKEIENFLKKPFFRNIKCRFSFNFNLHQLGQKNILDKIYKKVSILKNNNFKKHGEKLIINKKFFSVVAKKKVYSSMESHFSTKNNEDFLIEQEKRVDIDDLIRKEIIRIIKFKGKDAKKLDSSVKTSKLSSDGGGMELNTKIPVSNKNFNRKLIINVNQILALLEIIFI